MFRDNFHNFLKDKKFIPEKQIPFYLRWVSLFMEFCGELPIEKITDDHVDSFIKDLSRKREEWQVKQAKEAIGLYRFHHKRRIDKPEIEKSTNSEKWKKATDEMVKMLRLKQKSYRTENSYMRWLRSFYKYISPVLPEELNERNTFKGISYSSSS